MKLPRFQVRTLLVVTTVAALAMACLAPWLRLVTGEMAAGIAKRALCTLAGICFILFDDLVRRLSQKSKRTEGESLFTLRRARFQEPTFTALFGLIVSVSSIFLLEFVLRISSVRNDLLYYGVLVWWAAIGVWGAACGKAIRRSFVPVEITAESLLGHNIHSWRKLKHFWWPNKDAGCLILEFQRNAKEMYFTRTVESEVEAIDAFLSEKMAANAKQNPRNS